MKRILARIARFSRLECLRLLLPRLKCKTNMATRLQALQERKRYNRMKQKKQYR